MGVAHRHSWAVLIFWLRKSYWQTRQSGAIQSAWLPNLVYEANWVWRTSGSSLLTVSTHSTVFNWPFCHHFGRGNRLAHTRQGTKGSHGANFCFLALGGHLHIHLLFIIVFRKSIVKLLNYKFYESTHHQANQTY